jgi:hypothetical protein
VIATDWNERIALDPIVMPDATPDWVAHVIERGLAHASALGFEDVGLEVDRADDVLRDVLIGQGFEIEEDGVIETWLVADARPAISPLHEDYRMSSRGATMQRPHHMTNHERNHPDIEPRLRHVPCRTDAHRRRSPATRTRSPHPHHGHRPARQGRRKAHQDLL